MPGVSPKQVIIRLICLIIFIINPAFVPDQIQEKEIKQLSDKDLFQMLRKFANITNKSLPIVVESGLRCENVNALPGRKLQYSFTITDILKEEADSSLIKNFIANRKPVLTSAVRADSSLMFFRQQKVIFIYTYRDKFSNYLYNIIIKPEDYQNSYQ